MSWDQPAHRIDIRCVRGERSYRSEKADLVIYILVNYLKFIAVDAFQVYG